MAEIANEQIREANTVMELDAGAYMAISALEGPDGGQLIGNVLRRTCPVFGERACAATCQLSVIKGSAPQEALREDTWAHLEAQGIGQDDIEDYFPMECSDDALSVELDTLEIPHEQALIVGVTADRVGFLDDPEVQANISKNSFGWSEISGYNAFFARRDDTLPNSGPDGGPHKLRLLGARLADSGFVVVGMTDAGGNRIEGIIHSTRTNMPGRQHRNEYGGEQQGFIHYALREAMARYSVDPSNVYLKMVAAVGPEAWQKRYPNTGVLEDNLPGWAEDGLIQNKSNPNWQPGMEVVNPATEEYDVLWPQYPHKVRMEIIEAAALLGIEDIRLDGALDPGKPNGHRTHSSANRLRIAQPGDQLIDSRDLYAVVLPEDTDR